MQLRVWKNASRPKTGSAPLLAAPATAQPPTETPVSVSATFGLSDDTGIKPCWLIRGPKTSSRRPPTTFVEFFASGQAEGLMPADAPMTTLTQNPMAIDAGLNTANMKKISEELADR